MKYSKKVISNIEKLNPGQDITLIIKAYYIAKWKKVLLIGSILFFVNLSVLLNTHKNKILNANSIQSNQNMEEVKLNVLIGEENGEEILYTLYPR